MAQWDRAPSLVYRPPISDLRLMRVTLLRTSTYCGPTEGIGASSRTKLNKDKIELTIAFHQAFHRFSLRKPRPERAGFAALLFSFDFVSHLTQHLRHYTA